jgi:hypothetical protein
MEVIEIGGDDPRLYGLVAHLVMDEQVVEYNQGYPFRTSAAYRWFVAVDGGATVGFVPARIDGDKAKINNYWVGGDSAAVFHALLVGAARSLGPKYAVESATQTRHTAHFEKAGFVVAFLWKKYAKMKLPANG